MGMCLGLVTLSDANIARLLDDPPLVRQAIAPDDPEPYQEARTAQRRPTLLSRLLGRGRQPESVPDLTLSPGEGSATDLDEARLLAIADLVAMAPPATEHVPLSWDDVELALARKTFELHGGHIRVRRDHIALRLPLAGSDSD